MSDIGHPVSRGSTKRSKRSARDDRSPFGDEKEQQAGLWELGDEGDRRATPRGGQAPSNELQQREGKPADDYDKDDKEDDAAVEKRRAFFGNPFVLATGAIILVLAVAGGILWWLQARQYESTDDAFIDAHIVRIAPEIAGQLTAIHVQDNQLVQAGSILIDIDSSEAQARVDQAAAQTAQAETARGQAEAQIRVADASHQQALATAAAARIEAEKAARDLARYRALLNLNKGAVAQAQIDQADAQARNTAAQATAAANQAKAIEAQRSAAEAQAKGAQSRIDAVKAQVSQAQINLGHTRILAPISGHIAQRNAALGNYVTPGQQLMAIIPLELWVTANFKETQLARMRIGQTVDITVDACPNAKISGHIDSIQRGAGQAFGVLPPENATGNFVKVVQRVPVKIVLDMVPMECPLGPGMSAEPSVKVR